MRAAAIALGLASLASPAVADDVAATQVARVHFATDATPDVIQRVACELNARVEIGGQQRALDVRMVIVSNESRRCSSTPDALVLTVSMTVLNQVDVEVNVPDGAPPETAREIGNLVQAVAGEIKRRAAAERPAPIVQTEAFSPGLTVGGIALAAAGIGAIITGYVVVAAGAGVSCGGSQGCGNDTGPLIGGAALLLAGVAAIPLGAVLAVIGEHRVPVQTARVVPWIAPRVGGAQAGLSLAF